MRNGSQKRIAGFGMILVCSLQWKDVIGTRLYAHLSQRRLGVRAERLKNSEKSEKINYPENHVK